MKRIRRSIPTLALLVLLSGCAAQGEETSMPVEVPTIPTEVSELQQEDIKVTVPFMAVTESQIQETMPHQAQPIETEPEDPVDQTASPAVEPTTQPLGTESPETESTVTEPPETKPLETQPPETQSAETQPTETTPPEMTPPETESPASGDLYSASEAILVGNNYAESAYGMCADGTLGFSNASYEFADTAYVSGLRILGGQSFLNQMVKEKVDSLVANLRGAYGVDTDISAYRVNCYVEYDPEGELYWIYVFYG